MKQTCEHCNNTGFRKIMDEDGNEVMKLCECTEEGGLNGDDNDESNHDIGSGVLVRV